jgi:hypothetical protein
LCNPCDEDEEKDDQFSSFFQVMEHRWNEVYRRNPKYSGKNLSSATFSSTNPTWIDPGLNPDLRGGRLAINRLSHGTAYSSLK